jgi:hypothetical protein
MAEFVAEERKDWLQIYVDAMTEKDPYKRLALVRRLRQLPRHDESDETPERPRLQIIPKPALSKPPLPRLAGSAPKAKPASPHLMRTRKPKTALKPGRSGPRLRSA